MAESFLSIVISIIPVNNPPFLFSSRKDILIDRSLPGRIKFNKTNFNKKSLEILIKKNGYRHRIDFFI